MGKLLGLDWGEKRIGLSLSDEEQKRAFPHGVIENNEKILDEVKSIITKESVDKIIIGLPLSLEGQPTQQTEKVKNFADRIKEYCQVSLDYEDERLTTRGSEVLLQEAQKKSKQIKEMVDQQAAQLILQGYLDRHA